MAPSKWAMHGEDDMSSSILRISVFLDLGAEVLIADEHRTGCNFSFSVFEVLFAISAYMLSRRIGV